MWCLTETDTQWHAWSLRKFVCTNPQKISRHSSHAHRHSSSNDQQQC